MLILCIYKESRISEEIIDKDISNTKKYQSHIPCGFGCKVICVDNKFNKDILL